MSMHTLFADVDGFDLQDVADEVEELCEAFVAGRRWQFGTPRIVNQRLETDERHTSNDLPEWELGINLDLPDPGCEPLGWFSDVEAIAGFLGTLHARTGREFVIGITDNQHGYSEDLFTVQSEHHRRRNRQLTQRWSGLRPAALLSYLARASIGPKPLSLKR